VEDHDGSFLQRQTGDRAKDLIVGQDTCERVSRLRADAVQGHKPDDLAAPQSVAACIDKDAVKPSAEAIIIPKILERPPRVGERILDGVFRVRGVPKEQPRKAVGSIQTRFRKQNEPPRDVVGGRPLIRIVSARGVGHHTIKTNKGQRGFSECVLPDPPSRGASLHPGVG
jgi:hypothetical protein